MKKGILFSVIIMMAFGQTINAQRSESWYRNYFREHIEELDPIEGVYSVNIHAVSKHGITEESRQNIRVAIIKEGYYYVQYKFGNERSPSVTKFNRIGETSAYDYTVKWNCCSETATGRLYMESLFGFDYTLSMPTSVIRATLRTGKEYAHLFKVTGDYQYIKDYPTRSMYEDLIAEAQRKAEESSKPTSWSGTGWAIGNGYIVTNNHVIDDAHSITVRGVGGNLNTGYSAEVVARDRINDIAILKINDRQFNGYGNIPYGISSRIADVGEDVFVLGWPLGQLLGEEVKYTTGSINSRTGFGDFQNCYQIQAPITHGNSGGPVFDNKGNVIGIVVAGLNKELNLAENVGYAIKTSYLKILVMR